MAQIVDNDFSRAKSLLPTTIAALENLQHAMVGSRRIMPGPQSFVAIRVKRLAKVVHRLDAVPAQQLMQLLEGHLNALTEVLGQAAGGEGPFQIVDDGQQVLDEPFF